MRGRVFLAYADEDRSAALALYDRLKESGYAPWLDEIDVLPGQNRDKEIANAIASSAAVLALLSS